MRTNAFIRRLATACALTLLATSAAFAATPLTFKDLMIEISTDDILKLKRVEVIEDRQVIDACADLNLPFCVKEVWQESWVACVRPFPNQPIVAYECGARRTETKRCTDHRWQTEISYADDNRYCFENPAYLSLCGNQTGRIRSSDVRLSVTGC